MADLRAMVVVSAVILGLTGCAHDAPVRPRPVEGTTMSAPPVRTDREPIAKRFPALGDFVDVHWQGSAAGVDTGGVPGPTDVRIQALAVVRPDVLASAASRYEWKPAPSGWNASLSAELRPFAPASADWQASEPFAADVRTARYSGPVYLDLTSGTVFLDVIGG